ncbi:D-tyrosyl-tRNA deacylase [Saccharata proteae CBS 121410]|uniref:D-aminoacyl-tRNA deacylase n=1 Tax=Saccharata proteae CBS 121410 TaxID=1314787 RepID=A0A9P4HWH3_9PEZI|nr:D-tyrosyl-tRNA deacylase [Saccharata proteae CBS 121410]
MKAVLQRVKSASVTVDGQLISSIGKGILVLAAVGKDDTKKDAEAMAGKVLKLQMWDDDKGGRWKKNVRDIGGEILCVSQFTLLASTKKGNKPSFHKSAGPDPAKELYTAFFSKVQDLYEKGKVKDGVFQAMMDVALVNDGPVTLEIDTDPPKMDIPGATDSSGDKVKLEDLLTKIGKIQKEYQIPAELLQ